MLTWCSNCYHFIGENPPFDDLTVEYQVCSDCDCKPLSTNSKKEHDLNIKRMMFSLWEAGTQDNISGGIQLLQQALKIGMRPMDIAMGILTPLLYRMGNEWACNRATVADEHRFTAFIETLFSSLTRELRLQNETNLKSKKPNILLFNTENNCHDIAIRILEIWFYSAGFTARALLPTPSTAILIEAIERNRPDFIGISVNSSDHISQIQNLVTTIQKIPTNNSLQIMIGGFAVKQGLIPSIPGAILIPDIRMFQNLLRLKNNSLDF